ncbi:MAG TPA: glycosyltransferase [Opitutaceae bacterium]|nr:glycosyltransferase [Opitutaceae bacterium]
MKLCHIVPSVEEQYGGPSKSVRSLCGALATVGHTVDLFATHLEAPRDGTVQSAGALRTTLFKRDWPGRICPSAGLRAALEPADAAVFQHHSVWLRTLHYAHEAARRHHAPLVISPRGMLSRWAWRHHSWRKAFARQLVHPGAFEGAAGWHATSSEEANDIRSLGFNQPVCVAPNGVESPTDAELAAAKSLWEETCPAVTRQPVALFYSRLHRKKRVLELIDLWLEQAPADWLLCIVGIPQDYTPESLEQYVQRLSGRGRVVAFSGAGRPPPYAIASLFVLPSHTENVGLVIAEAMASGVPVLVTDSTPWSGVQREQVGWCVPWEEYARTLRIATAESAEQLRARGQRAREWVLRGFSWRRSAEQLNEFYAALPRPAA